MSKKIVGTLIVLSFLAGCSAETQTPDPYSAEMERAKKAASTDFEKGALADSKISRSEYEEAVSRFIDCVRRRGVSIDRKNQFGYYIYETVGAPDALEAQDDCSKGTKGLIEPLYVSRLTNPNKEDVNILFAACLVKAGVAPAGYTAEMAKNDKSQSFANAPYDPSDKRVNQCMANPVY